MSQHSHLRSLLTATVLAFAAALITTPIHAQSPQPRTPVLVELFTSEGCSSCPPADTLLARLDHDQPIPTADIIILEEHVDYWDQLGWHDRFSSPLYTERQRLYGRRFHTEDIYTPQMIVNGQDQFAGSDASRARQSILHAAQSPVVSLTLSRPVTDGHRISASVTSTFAPQQKGDLYAALVQSSAVTDVRRGENSGRQLRHAGVVLALEHIGSLSDLANAKSLTLNAPADTSPSSLRVVVFAQVKDQGPILAATSADINNQ